MQDSQDCVHPVVNSLQHFGFSYVMYILYIQAFIQLTDVVEAVCRGVCPAGS